MIKYKSGNGIAEPMPLSDLQTFNKELARRNKIEFIDLMVRCVFFIFIIMAAFTYLQRCIC